MSVSQRTRARCDAKIPGVNTHLTNIVWMKQPVRPFTETCRIRSIESGRTNALPAA